MKLSGFSLLVVAFTLGVSAAPWKGFGLEPRDCNKESCLKTVKLDVRAKLHIARVPPSYDQNSSNEDPSKKGTSKGGDDKKDEDPGKKGSSKEGNKKDGDDKDSKDCKKNPNSKDCKKDGDSEESADCKKNPDSKVCKKDGDPEKDEDSKKGGGSSSGGEKNSSKKGKARPSGIGGAPPAKPDPSPKGSPKGKPPSTAPAYRPPATTEVPKGGSKPPSEGKPPSTGPPSYGEPPAATPAPKDPKPPGGGGYNSGGGLPKASGTSILAAVQTIAPGASFDGGMVQFDRGTPCTEGEGKGSDAVFNIQEGGSISNVIIGPNQKEGIHCYGACTITNVWWADVCEDAFTIKRQDATVTTKIIGGGAFGAKDKVLQHNGAGTLDVSGFTCSDFGKLYRACGNCEGGFTRHVKLDGITASNGRVLVGINRNFGDTAIITNSKLSGVKEVCTEFNGVGPGKEPEKLKTGPDSDICKYGSDVTVS